jgi:dTDP-4-amino-4,6-dideoxygalactose transaminase
VATAIYYPIPVHRQAYVLERGIDVHMPVSERLAERTLSIPLYPTLTEDEIETVIAAVRAAVGRHVQAAAR